MTTPDLFAEPPSPDPEYPDVPWTLDGGIKEFLHCWAFNWRGEHAVIEQSLRALIAQAKAEG